MLYGYFRRQNEQNELEQNEHVSFYRYFIYMHVTFP